MSKFSDILLQLHAEGEQIAQPTSESVADVQPTAPSEPVTRSGQQATFGLKVDKNTGRRSVVMIRNDEQPTESVRQPPSQPTNQTNQTNQPANQDVQYNNQPMEQSNLFNIENSEPKPYRDTAELLQAIQHNVVDERRIPMEQAFAYANYKQQVMQQAMQQQQAQPPAEDNSAARENFYTRIEEASRNAALQDLGLTEDDLVMAEYSEDEELQARVKRFETSLAWNRNSIMAQVQAEQQRAYNERMAVQQIYSDIDSKVAEYQRNEPEFQNINVMMNTYFTELPYKEAQKYATAINAYQAGNINVEQAQALQEYYDKTRVAYYAKKNNLGTPNSLRVVPKVEQAGSASSNYQDNSVTKEQLRNAGDYRLRRALIGQILNRRNK